MINGNIAEKLFKVLLCKLFDEKGDDTELMSRWRIFQFGMQGSFSIFLQIFAEPSFT